MLQLDAALDEKRYGDLQRLTETLDEREILPEQMEHAVKLWKAEEDRVWEELDRIEDLADEEAWPAALTALAALPADPLHATSEVVERHAELSQTIRADANAALDQALRSSANLVKKGKIEAARKALQLAESTAAAVGRSADLERALGSLPKQ